MQSFISSRTTCLAAVLTGAMAGTAWAASSAVLVAMPGSPGVIQILDIPGLQMQPFVRTATASPMDLKVVRNMLYVATATQIEQYAIDSNGKLTLKGQTLTGGIPTRGIVATASAVYAPRWGTPDLGVFPIDAAGLLGAGQTTATGTPNNIYSMGTDDAGKFLFIGKAAPNGISGQVCVRTIQTGGALTPAPGNCVMPRGAPQSMTFKNGVLYMVLFGPEQPYGNAYYLSAWTLNTANGTLSLRGTELNAGRATTGKPGVSADGRFVFLPRQGSFQTINASTLQIVANATPVRGSQWCVWPPASGGEVGIDGAGQNIYVSDPVGSPNGNIQGGRVSELRVDANGALTPTICQAVGTRPAALAVWRYVRTLIPRPPIRPIR